MKKLVGIALLASFLLSGCGDSTSKAKELPKDTTHKAVAAETKVVKKSAEVAKLMPKESKEKEVGVKKSQTPNVSKFYTIFKDAAKIAPDGKEMLLVFGQDGDPYTDKLKEDILNDSDLESAIKEIVTPIYIDARGKKMHKFLHNGELMDVDTKTLVSIYNVSATPTLIFADKEAGHIFVVPGYMPPKQFKATLDFVKEGAWKGKDRKNGEVYKALKQYYEAHGIQIKAAKK